MPELRESGIDILGKIPWGLHFCNFYETKQDLLDTVVPYFKTGLESKEFCLWIVSNSGLITVDAAKEAFKQVVPDLERYLSNGNIEILNESEWYLEGNVFNVEKVINAWHVKLKRALTLGYDGMRVSGDTFWLTEKDWKDFVDYEKQLNNSIIDLPMTLLCTYPMAKSGAAEILDVAHHHQFAIVRRKGEWEAVETSMQIQAQAEIERLNKKLQKTKIQRTKPSEILGYAVAVLSVTLALIVAQFLDVHLVTAPVSLFFCALMFSAWYGGIKPGLLSVVLTLLAFKFFFVNPIYSLTLDLKEIPRFIIFSLSALFVVLLSAAQKNIAESLRRAHNVLEGTVQKLRQTNTALQAEIAERKHADDALRKSEDSIRLIIDTIPIMAWTFRPDGIVDFANQRWLDYAGEGAFEDPNRIVHPDDLPAVMEKWLANMVIAKAYEDEMRLRRVDGEYRWFLVRTAPLRNEHGNPVKWYGVSIDIQDSKRAEDELRQSYEEIRRLTEHLQKIREEERTSIAREIHDELGQQLSALKMEVKGLNKKLKDADEGIKQKIADIIDLLETSVISVRRISSELRPSLLYNLGLVAAMEWHLKEFEKRSGIKIIFNEPKEELELTDSLKNGLFRIFQESLTNVSRHANANQVKVSLDQKEQQLILSIEDDGQGFEKEKIAAKDTLGILGMKERSQMMGGNYEINSIPGKGTAVIVAVPYDDKK